MGAPLNARAASARSRCCRCHRVHRLRPPARLPHLRVAWASAAFLMVKSGAQRRHLQRLVRLTAQVNSSARAAIRVGRGFAPSSRSDAVCRGVGLPRIYGQGSPAVLPSNFPESRASPIVVGSNGVRSWCHGSCASDEGSGAVASASHQGCAGGFHSPWLKTLTASACPPGSGHGITDHTESNLVLGNFEQPFNVLGCAHSQTN